MRILYLLRHAKSDRGDPELSDVDRPLAPRGRRDVPTMAAYMREHDYRPDLILCSPAARTRETLALLQPMLGPDIRVDFDRKLYLGSPDLLLRRLRDVEETVPSVLLIGHNPGLERLAAALAPRGDRRALARMREKYPTCGLAIIHLHIDRWEQTDLGAGTLTDFMVPAGLDED
ncbi:MAG TPA: histidine phosphatase family protein [Candidatus Angelobacter sp.]|nr:histidine phosphatase family protein [Candidatus Angelobacter sp.]